MSFLLAAGGAEGAALEAINRATFLVRDDREVLLRRVWFCKWHRLQPVWTSTATSLTEIIATFDSAITGH